MIQRNKSVISIQLPSVIGWLLYVRSLKLIWQELQSKYAAAHLLTRRLNQDRLENFFSQSRFHGGHRDNPDSMQFNAAYKQLTISRILTPVSNKNCEDDVENFLINLESFASTRQTENQENQREFLSFPACENQLPPLPGHIDELMVELAS